ncbi:hypothetical protein AGABI2DRAFT_117399 [Agaricus bisporus var. bisporus H97]|uniref:hypothetical protein n=1 Tax=Agaricus bisporus var. bisporus (strain H97 / ATCC MYA-4626 / FGSC 10389) TaxID=936046 RepID=UPI00029F5F1B|nr:hypothetical protein AGABI2DRAFT_117399 [Agaricus bisporus var. bisporus H97]EKV48590.1 hypothetical protein AGABI2DRAFT_117399 [Agaricus bisporus var. bisporus H97]
MTDPAILSIAKELAEGLHTSRTVNYAHLSGFIIVLLRQYFDWILTFDSEVRLIWSVEGVKMKVLYSLTRYLPLAYFPLFLNYRLITGHSESECNALYQAVGLMFTIGAICAALIVTIRTWAVWGKAKYMTYLLFGTYTVASVLILVFFILSVEYTTRVFYSVLLHTATEMQNHSAADPVFKEFALGCNPKFETPYLPAAFVVEAVYDTAILLLMLIRGASLFRQGVDSRLFRTIYSDGILFYVYISVISITNFGFLFSRGRYESFLLMFQGGARSIFACRIVLGIREQYEKLQAKGPLNIRNDYVAPHFETRGMESEEV